MAVGTSELLDAFAALGEVSWTEQEDFREALGATLAKSQEDRRVLELVFDRFFFRAVEREAVGQGVNERTGLRGRRPSGIDLDTLRERIREALRRPAPTARCATWPGWPSRPSGARARARA